MLQINMPSIYPPSYAMVSNCHSNFMLLDHLGATSSPLGLDLDVADIFPCLPPEEAVSVQSNLALD